MYRLCLLVLLGVWHASAQLTTPAPGSAVDCNIVGIQNCGKCNLPGLTCAYCPLNFVLAPDYKSCIACDVNCIDCVLDSTGKIGVCQECAAGYEVKSDGTCTQCGSYCATCKFTDTAQTLTDCLMCFPAELGYPAYLLGAYSKQCQDCTQVTPGCASCSEAADKTLSCTGCQQGFVAVSSGGTKTCSACPSYCLSCTLAKGATSPTTCATCMTNYIANSASSPTFACLYCDPTRCSKCTTSAVTSYPAIAQCATCQKGYYLDSSNLCQPCPAGCATCTSASICQSCDPIGFFYDSTAKTCKACSYGCSTCTITSSGETCSACIAGFGLQGSGGVSSCQACPLYCTDCSDPSTCTACATVAGLATTLELVADVDGTFCYPCPLNCDVCTDGGNGDTVCTTCKAGYQAGTDMQGNSFCFQCPSRCATCTVDTNTYQTTCTACAKDTLGNDYYLNANSVCVSCAAQCTACTGTNNDCQACQPSFFLDTVPTKPICAKCTTAYCKTCTPDVDTCTVCYDGYYLDGTTGDCVACSEPNCICDATTTTCTACLVTPSVAPFNAYDGTNEVCDKCDVRCKAAANCLAGGLCNDCGSGYVPNGSPSGAKCLACDVNCDSASCTYTTAVECSLCVAGYYVNSAKGCSRCPTTGCSNCGTGPTATACTGCLSGYTSNNLSPVGCLLNPVGCATGYLDVDGKTVLCSLCDDGYVLNTNNLCDPCPADCTTCSADAKGVLSCSVCDAGFAVNSYACSECPEGCTACKNLNGEMFCTQCTPQGYYLDAKNGVCIACTLCTSCSASGCNAGTCVDGYGLASDRSCTDCSTLTTVSGCSNCTDVDSTGMSMCLDCGVGQVLDGWGANCVDDTVLTDCELSEFRPYECTPGSCNSPFEWVTDGPGRGQCGLHCAVCGDLSRGLFLAECQNANNNYTQQLVVGACWVGRTVDSAGNVLYARGGFDKYNCTSDNEWEFVDSSNSATTYKCCQSGDGCSDSIVLDGVAGASAISFSLALLFASILAALRLF